jgi:hypothetical protein
MAAPDRPVVLCNFAKVPSAPFLLPALAHPAFKIPQFAETSAKTRYYRSFLTSIVAILDESGLEPRFLCATRVSRHFESLVYRLTAHSYCDLETPAEYDMILFAHLILFLLN